MTTALAGTAEAAGASATQAPPADHSTALALALALGDGGAPEGRLRLVGHLASPEANDLRVFLTRNRVPFEWVDLDHDPLVGLLRAGGGAPPARAPVLLFPDGTRLEAPSRLEVARRVGLTTRPQQPVYDLAIIGGGPAGLTAAVYAASEGLRTVVVEREAPGGQAGTSARIENYPGFPQGVSGQELADRALEQARRFGAELVLANDVAAADPARRAPFCLTLRDGAELRCHALVVATGVAYRRLEAPGVGELTGKGICYGSGVAEARTYRGQDVFVAGGANAAGRRPSIWPRPPGTSPCSSGATRSRRACRTT